MNGSPSISSVPSSATSAGIVYRTERGRSSEPLPSADVRRVLLLFEAAEV